MLERGGNLKLLPMTYTAPNIQKAVKANVSETASLITDANSAYSDLKPVYASHEVVNHSAHEYVREGNIHTNSIEGAFSLLKRSIIGIYHQVTPKHLSRYCDETAYRYNLRKMKDSERFAFTLTNIEGRLTYKNLIAAEAPIKTPIRYEYPSVPDALAAKVKGRPVYQLFDGEIVGRFNSIKEASEMTGIPKASISRVLTGTKATTRGYQWSYA